MIKVVKFESHNGTVKIQFTGDSDTLAAELADLCVEICSDESTMHYFWHLIDGVESTLRKIKESKND